MELFLFSLATIFGVAAYAVYFRDIRKTVIAPNRWSWLIWGFTTAVEVWTYQAVSEDILKTAVFFVSTVSCAVITILIWRKAKWEMPEISEILSVIASIAAIVVLVVYHQAWWAHLIAMVAVPVSFIPTYRHAWKDWRKEDTPSWVLWTIGDTLAFLYILSSFDSFEEIPYAGIEAVCHAAMWFIVSWQGRRQSDHRVRKTEKFLGWVALLVLTIAAGVTAAGYLGLWFWESGQPGYVFIAIVSLALTLFASKLIAKKLRT